MSHEGSSDDLHDVPGDDDQAGEDEPAHFQGRRERRRSLMNHSSVKRLFKWKQR